jgi:hypothetical protein
VEADLCHPEQNFSLAVADPASAFELLTYETLLFIAFSYFPEPKVGSLHRLSFKSCFL